MPVPFKDVSAAANRPMARCTLYNTPSGCSRGLGCKFLHPPNSTDVVAVTPGDRACAACGAVCTVPATFAPRVSFADPAPGSVWDVLLGGEGGEGGGGSAPVWRGLCVLRRETGATPPHTCLAAMPLTRGPASGAGDSPPPATIVTDVFRGVSATTVTATVPVPLRLPPEAFGVVVVLFQSGVPIARAVARVDATSPVGGRLARPARPVSGGAVAPTPTPTRGPDLDPLAAVPSRTVFVGNLDRSVTADKLGASFGRFGRVVKTVIAVDARCVLCRAQEPPNVKL